MAIQIGAKPDSGFNDPIGMLKDCHRRIENFLRILCVVAERARGRELTHEEQEAVQSALQYFRNGGERHTADEEESLFPRLRDRAVAKAVEKLDLLESDHRRAGELHAVVDALYRTWMTTGRLSAAQEEQLLSATSEIEPLYAGHIQIEEQIVFPLAAEELDSASIAAIGQEFRDRRASN